MEVRNCRDCGKMFNYTTGAPLCPACIKKLDEKFAKVKEYIYDNPGVGIQQVSEAMEVSINLLKKWVREEKLTFAEGSSVGLDCERCGKTILSGRFCEECKRKVTKQLDNAYEKPRTAAPAKKNEQGSPKMRFLNN